MKILINNSSMVPIYEQICQQIKDQILENSLKAGDFLPSVRKLANSLKVSALTVKKSYDRLAEEGFIETVPGKGSYVLDINPNLEKEEILKNIEDDLETTIKKALASSIKKEDLVELFDLVLGDLYD
jgi:GntR family transcriptional regulator